MTKNLRLFVRLFILKARDYHVPVIVYLIYIGNDQRSETPRQSVYTQCSIYCKHSHVE